MTENSVSDSGENAPILITGAGGFLGQRIVAAALVAGHPVRAVLRDPNRIPEGWDGVDCIGADLGNPEDALALTQALTGVRAVIHAAAGQGDDAAHARNTVGATARLIEAMQTVTPMPRLVLVSSFSVYGYAALPDWATLDELTPPEIDAGQRDAYTRAKLTQEGLAICAAQSGGMAVRVIRPGAIYGPTRTETARLGWKKGRRLTPGSNVPVPAVHVDHVARALLAAALTPMIPVPDDWPIHQGPGRIDVINIVDPDTPTQAQWLTARGEGRALILPRGALMKLAKGLDLIGAFWPGLGRRLPSGLSEASLAARFKPLHYSAARARDRLNIEPEQGFSALMKESRT